MITLSLCMIVRDEADVIARCLESVKDVVDEIIIVDTGSVDETKTIVKQYTNKIYDFPWVDDFSKARNESFSKATMEYIMWLDADDVLTPENKAKLCDLKATLSKEIDVVQLQYHTGMDEFGNPTFTFYRERLVKRERNFQWIDPIHEVIAWSGNMIKSEIAILHQKLKLGDSNRNIRIFEKMQAQHIIFNARQEYYYGRELKAHKRYEEAIIYFNKVIDNQNAWIINRMEACIEISQCYALMGDSTNQLLSLLKSFTLDLPHAEACYEIGSIYFNKKDYQKAIFWYEMIFQLNIGEDNGFHQPDLYIYSPSMQLCVCYYQLGNLAKAKQYHERAKAVKPYDKKVLYNETFFASLSN